MWQRLSGASEKMESTIENYRILVTKETPDEKVVVANWCLTNVSGHISGHP